MAQQPIVRLDLADLRRTTDFQGDQEAGYFSAAGIYFRLCESCRHMSAAITRGVAGAIRPRDDSFGSDARAASFTLADRRIAWFGAVAGIAGLAALLLFAWSEFGAGMVSATERPADTSSAAAAPLIETPPERTEAIRRRGLELLRSDIPDDEPAQASARGDRLEPQDATIKPAMRIATAGADISVVAPAPLPVQPAADKPAKANDKAAKAKAAKERQARRAAKNARDQARAAQAKAVQAPAEPQTVPAAAPPEEDKPFGWVRRLPDTIAGGWENLWSKGNGSGAASCGPSANPATACPREAQAGPR